MNGDINTGILIRTTYLRDGVARYPWARPYCTIRFQLWKSRRRGQGHWLLPNTRLVNRAGRSLEYRPGEGHEATADNDDCFIHTLANYARQTGAEVVTYRAGFPLEMIAKIAPGLILISPGPGRPADFGVPDVVRQAVRQGIPVFGVCLGLQGVVEAFGGTLGVLGYPVHGKSSWVTHTGKGVFEGLPAKFQVGRSFPVCGARRSPMVSRVPPNPTMA